jgi:hypothetical protein
MSVVRRQLKLLAVLARPIIVAVLVYGLASAHPLTPPQRLASPATNYTVSGIHYTVDSADPGSLSRLTFRLAPTPPATMMVRAKLIRSSGVFFPCSNSPVGSPGWECPLRGVPVRAADLLTIEILAQPAPAQRTVYLPLMLRGQQYTLYQPIVRR